MAQAFGFERILTLLMLRGDQGSENGEFQVDCVLRKRSSVLSGQWERGSWTGGKEEEKQP